MDTLCTCLPRKVLELMCWVERGSANLDTTHDQSRIDCFKQKRTD